MNTTYGIRLAGSDFTARIYRTRGAATNDAKRIANDQHRDWEVLEIQNLGTRTDTSTSFHRQITRRTLRPIMRVKPDGTVEDL